VFTLGNDPEFQQLHIERGEEKKRGEEKGEKRKERKKRGEKGEERFKSCCEMTRAFSSILEIN